jgi:hypothetical protein
MSSVQQPQLPAIGARRSIVFFMPPPPMTLWLQLQDGTQIGFSGTPDQVFNTIMGFPGGPRQEDQESSSTRLGGLFNLFGGGRNDENVSSGGGLMQMLHDLFMRAQSENHGPPPTSKMFLNQLPIKVWTDQMKKVEKHGDCPICLSDYESGEEVISLPCGHAFHKACGTQWLVDHNVCPTCRHQLPTEEDEAKKKAQDQTTLNENQTEPESEEITIINHQQEEENRRPRLRRQLSPRNSELERCVRPRIDDGFSLSQSSEDEMDRLMEEEAENLIQEQEESERVKKETNFDDDMDVEELLRSTV